MACLGLPASAWTALYFRFPGQEAHQAHIDGVRFAEHLWRLGVLPPSRAKREQAERVLGMFNAVLLPGVQSFVAGARGLSILDLVLYEWLRANAVAREFVSPGARCTSPLQGLVRFCVMMESQPLLAKREGAFVVDYANSRTVPVADAWANTLPAQPWTAHARLWGLQTPVPVPGLPPPAKGSCLLRVGFYNILSEQVLNRHKREYQWMDTDFDWKRARRPALIEAIKGMEAGVVGLAEVDEGETHKAFEKAICHGGAYGVKWHFRPSFPGRGGRDGIGLMWKRSQLTDKGAWLTVCLDDAEKVFPQLGIKTPGTTRNVAMFGVLDSEVAQVRVCVGVTHLYWDPQHEPFKQAQAELYRSLGERFAAKWNASHLILMGDFNTIAGTGSYWKMLRGVSAKLPSIEGIADGWHMPPMREEERDGGQLFFLEQSKLERLEDDAHIPRR
eukprot:Hpha_TRINITY_DN16450_c2_g4::TRINITY_DN16450_c2_g4_i2::g.163913::m.163913